MKTWPEFVIEADEAHRALARGGELTGWETVVFEVGDAQEEESDSSTAALAP
jgi:hypothetical protein